MANPTKWISIQQVIEEKLFNLYDKQARIPIEGSGRTDAGVHAIGQCAHYTEPEKPNLENEKSSSYSISG